MSESYAQILIDTSSYGDVRKVEDAVKDIHENEGISIHTGWRYVRENLHREAEAKLAKAIALLEQAECPDVDGGDRRCIGGFSHYLALTGKYNSLHECPFCAERKQLLGERG